MDQTELEPTSLANKGTGSPQRALEETEPLDAPTQEMVDPEPAGGRIGLAKETDPVGTDPEMVDPVHHDPVGAGTELKEVTDPGRVNPVPLLDLETVPVDTDLEQEGNHKETEHADNLIPSVELAKKDMEKELEEAVDHKMTPVIAIVEPL
jgi:hypothetical protein